VLEVIDKGHCSDAHPTPVLFVHGALHAAWCWDEHFLNFFADNGYRVLALSLRGHGCSPTSKRLRSCSIADYVEDMCSVADSLPATPLVTGHSMGGFIVQKYLETHRAPAGVLMASEPPRGHLRAALRSIGRDPWRSARSMMSDKPSILFNTPDLARESFLLCTYAGVNRRAHNGSATGRVPACAQSRRDVLQPGQVQVT